MMIWEGDVCHAQVLPMYPAMYNVNINLWFTPPALCNLCKNYNTLKEPLTNMIMWKSMGHSSLQYSDKALLI